MKRAIFNEIISFSLCLMWTFILNIIQFFMRRWHLTVLSFWCDTTVITLIQFMSIDFNLDFCRWTRLWPNLNNVHLWRRRGISSNVENYWWFEGTCILCIIEWPLKIEFIIVVCTSRLRQGSPVHKWRRYSTIRWYTLFRAKPSQPIRVSFFRRF